MDGWKCAAKRSRTRLLAPSAASTRSAAGSPSGSTSVSNRSETPSPAARSCRMRRNSRREMPQKPWPVERMRSPRKKMSMSVQYAKRDVIARCVSGSASSKLPSVSSEKTTPQPNVSSARFRSWTVTSCAGSSRFMRMAK